MNQPFPVRHSDAARHPVAIELVSDRDMTAPAADPAGHQNGFQSIAAAPAGRDDAHGFNWAVLWIWGGLVASLVWFALLAWMLGGLLYIW